VIAALLLLAAQAAGTYYQQGVDLYQKGRADEARVHLKRAVEQEPSARHWKALGVLEASVRQYAEAEPALREACRLDPKEQDACYYWGRALYALDRFQASLAALEQALAIDRQPGRAHLGMAQALEALGRAAEAERQFRRAVELGAGASADLDPRLHFGIFLYRQGRTEEAIGRLRSARPSARTHYNLGRALFQQGRLDEAERQLRDAIRLDPAYAEAHLQLAGLYRRLGRVEDAERHAKQADQGSRSSR